MKSVVRRCSTFKVEVFPSGNKKIFRKNVKKTVPAKEPREAKERNEFRLNPVKIQMLSQSLYDQVFRNSPEGKAPDDLAVNR